MACVMSQESSDVNVNSTSKFSTGDVVGEDVGFLDGFDVVGNNVGEHVVGTNEGESVVGTNVGESVVGMNEGASVDGELVGETVGLSETGAFDGDLRAIVGAFVGVDVTGLIVGECVDIFSVEIGVGKAVGITVGFGEGFKEGLSVDVVVAAQNCQSNIPCTNTSSSKGMHPMLGV